MPRDLLLVLLLTGHALGSALWVGGQLALLPMTRALRDDREKLKLVARRAQPVLWSGLVLATASGVALWRGPGPLLATKVGLVIVAAGAAATHTVNARRGGAPWVTGAGAALALLASLALVLVGAMLRAS